MKGRVPSIPRGRARGEWQGGGRDFSPISGITPCLPVAGCGVAGAPAVEVEKYLAESKSFQKCLHWVPSLAIPEK